MSGARVPRHAGPESRVVPCLWRSQAETLMEACKGKGERTEAKKKACQAKCRVRNGGGSRATCGSSCDPLAPGPPSLATAIHTKTMADTCVFQRWYHCCLHHFPRRKRGQDPVKQATPSFPRHSPPPPAPQSYPRSLIKKKSLAEHAAKHQPMATVGGGLGALPGVKPIHWCAPPHPVHPTVPYPTGRLRFSFL